MSNSAGANHGIDQDGNGRPGTRDPERESPVLSAQQQQKTAPITYSRKERTVRSPAAASSEVIDSKQGKRMSAGVKTWFEAKAKVRRGASARKVVDVYDDIEGANGGQREGAGAAGSLKGAPSPRAPKTTFDSSKSQNAREGVNQRKTVNGAGSTGVPMKRSRLSKRSPAANEEAGRPVIANGTRDYNGGIVQPVLAEGEEWDENVDEYEVLDSGDDKTRDMQSSKRRKISTGLESNGTGVWKGYVYGKPKKTFEDEIRELEETARKEAEDHDSEDELVSRHPPARTSARKATPRSTTSTAKVETMPPSRQKAKSVKPLDRRKAQASMATSGHAHVPVQEDGMEVDEEEEEQPRKSASTKATARADPLSQVTTPRKSPGRPPQEARRDVSFNFEPHDLSRIQRVVLERVTGTQAIPVQNFTDEYAKVFSVVNQTIKSGESNSMLLIGARGSGKTTLINQVLREQTKKYADDFHVVRLNGFIHTDDKIALREIWRQLGREMEIDEDKATSKNYADTMSKLLALLSHPSETGTDALNRVTKSVIFVLDEFELFAGHSRQTLLYNLFDVAQSRKAPIAVLGLTTHIGVAESLEKRVKSRFSHRYVHLSLPKSFQSFEQICRSALAVKSEDMKPGEHPGMWCKPISDESSALSHWHTLIEQLLASEPCNAYLRRLYHTTKSVSDFFRSMSRALATITITSSTTSNLMDHFLEVFSQRAMHPPDSRLTILATLGTLELALLICAARLTNIYSTEIISFAMVYQEYKDLASKARLQASASGLAQGAGSKIWGKGVAKGAWEELVGCGLILEDGRAGGTGRVDVGLEEIGMSGAELGQWGRWCKEI